MGIFGWSYPPGAANDPYAPYNQTDDDDDFSLDPAEPKIEGKMVPDEDMNEEQEEQNDIDK